MLKSSEGSKLVGPSNGFLTTCVEPQVGWLKQVGMQASPMTSWSFLIAWQSQGNWVSYTMY